jgi:hypothetical protein
MTQAEQSIIEDALRVCPDVNPWDVVQLISLRQAELEQEPNEYN